MEDDIEFKTIPTVQCSTANDQCVKVKAVNEGLEFVIRGCRSRIYKADVSIPQNLHCRSGSPSLCFCKENFCNSASSKFQNLLLASTLIFLIIFFFFQF
uniref:Protein quiver n=1 Tax=Meloidogyne incognita TaxID=6306 RepID=A0A914KPZ4_MELIC